MAKVVPKKDKQRATAGTGPTEEVARKAQEEEEQRHGEEEVENGEEESPGVDGDEDAEEEGGEEDEEEGAAEVEEEDGGEEAEEEEEVEGEEQEEGEEEEEERTAGQEEVEDGEDVPAEGGEGASLPEDVGEGEEKDYEEHSNNVEAKGEEAEEEWAEDDGDQDGTGGEAGSVRAHAHEDGDGGEEEAAEWGEGGAEEEWEEEWEEEGRGRREDGLGTASSSATRPAGRLAKDPTPAWPELGAAGTGRRKGAGTQVGGQGAEALAPRPPPAKGRSQGKGRGDGDGGPAWEIRRLQEENRILRLEIGQERYKVQQLGKLRDQAALSHRRELQAKHNEARALRELQEAKEYVDRRSQLVHNEKAALLLQVKNLERELREAADREYGLQAELRESLADSRSAASRIEDAEREAQRWKKEVLEQAVRLKKGDQRILQLEQKHLEDKAKIKALAEQLRLSGLGGALVPPASSSPSAPSSKACSAQKEEDIKRGSSPSVTGKAPTAGLVASKGKELRQLAEYDPFEGAAVPRWRQALSRAFPSVWSSSSDAAAGPGRGAGQGKKGRRPAAAAGDAGVLEALGESDAAVAYRQRQILAGLVLLIVALVVAKLPTS